MRRIRQHVNPLGAKFLQPSAARIDVAERTWVEVELGCGDGDFSIDLARSRPSWQVVGLDIRAACIERNIRLADALGLGNLRFAYANLTVDLEHVFAPQTVQRFHLLFPDPWFKARHQKRRVLETKLVDVLLSRLRPGGEIHVASDVFELALEAMTLFEHAACKGGVRNLVGPWSFASTSPHPVQSRRELATLRRGQRVWRLRYGTESDSMVGSESLSCSSAQRS